MSFYDVVFLRRFITAAQEDDYFMMLSFVIKFLAPLAI